MSNVVHHFLAAAWSYAFVAGGLTVLSGIWLRGRLDGVSHPREFDSPSVYLALVVPGLLPLVWLTSGLIHLSESGALSEACCAMLSMADRAGLQWFFGLAAVVLVAVQSRSLWKHWRPRHGTHRVSSHADALRRVQEVCAGHPALREIEARVRVVECGAHVCATSGVFGRRIEIASSLVERLDDEALEAALLHEFGHLAEHDPLRQLLLMLSQVLNPFAPMLARATTAWRFAREISCDRTAVANGAQRVAVADAIVTAARALSGTPTSACAHLCGQPIDALEARVQLLLHDSSSGRGTRSATGRAAASMLLAIALIVPHVLGARVISFHCVVEETFNTLLFLY